MPLYSISGFVRYSPSQAGACVSLIERDPGVNRPV